MPFFRWCGSAPPLHGPRSSIEERLFVKQVVAGASPVEDPMSYKKKKLKQSKLNQFKYQLGRIKLALLKQAKVLLPRMRSSGKKVKEEIAMFQLEKARKAIMRYDRLKNNPDRPNLEKMIIGQLETDGLLRLCVFVCPKFNTKVLSSPTPENYMPIESGPDLFEPRIAKIISLRKDLMRAGLPTEINIIIGDNDAEEYIFPFVQSVIIDKELYKQRQILYRSSFEQRCWKMFGKQGCIIWSLAESNIRPDIVPVTISLAGLQKELQFFKWLFSKEGPYRGSLSFRDDTLQKMVDIKYKLYGAQGKFLEVLGGILLQTEGPGMWLERTAMLRSTGSTAIPTIYPWIRKDER